MLIVLPGATKLPKKKFSHIKLPCRCGASIICHNGVIDGDCDCSLYECERCGLVVTVHDYWNMRLGITVSVGDISVGTSNGINPPYYSLSRFIGNT